MISFRFGYRDGQAALGIELDLTIRAKIIGGLVRMELMTERAFNRLNALGDRTRAALEVAVRRNRYPARHGLPLNLQEPRPRPAHDSTTLGPSPTASSRHWPAGGVRHDRTLRFVITWRGIGMILALVRQRLRNDEW